MLVIGTLAMHKGMVFKVPTRTDVKATLLWEPVDGAKAMTQQKAK